MDLLSLSPLQASLVLFRQTSGEWAHTVVCKATFALSPGPARLAAEQEPPSEDDNHWNDDPARSLYAPSDLAPLKPRADVLLVGNAFAPGGTPVRSLTVRLATCGIDKSIEVIGDRAARDGKAQEPAWFTSMPLRYERAAGGPDTWNPVGISPLARPDAHGLVRLPNLAPVGMGPRDPSAPVPPVGFGPIAPRWPLRASKLGLHAGMLADPGWRHRPLPEAIDAGFWNAAPHDQQPSEIREDAQILLENLSREHARLATSLPGIRPRVFVERATAPRREIKVTCDTLWIDTDRSICTLVWRGLVPLASAEERGRIAIAMEERDKRLSPGDIDRMLGTGHARGAPMGDVKVTTAPDDEPVFDETLRLSGTQQNRGPSAAPKGPAWLASPKPEQRAPAAPAPEARSAAPAPEARFAAPASEARSAAPAPPPLLPVPAVVDRPPLGAGESPWAADARAGITPSPPALVVEPAAPLPIPKVAPPSKPAGDEVANVVELVWLEPKFALKIRKTPGWKKLIGEGKARTSEDESDLETSTERKEAKERRDVTWILKRGDAGGAEALDDALDRAMSDGTFVPPLVLLAGELELPFDEIEALKTTIAVATSFAAADKQLKDAIDKGKEALEAPFVDRAVVEKLTARIREVFAQGQRPVPPGYLAAQAERALLEERRFQKRTLVGQAWIRGLMTFAGASAEGAVSGASAGGAASGASAGGAASGASAAPAPVPTYLPESLAGELPMFQRFKARLIAEARPALDQYEAAPTSLRVVALGRLIAPPRRR
jgi:hypothetical protein